MKRKIIMTFLMFAAVAMTAMAWGDVVSPPQYHGERLAPMPSALGIMLYMAFFACMAGVVISVIKTVRSRKIGRSRKLLNIFVALWFVSATITSLCVFWDCLSTLLTFELASTFRCRKCNSTFKKSELADDAAASYSISPIWVNDRYRRRYMYDCPKCSRWYRH